MMLLKPETCRSCVGAMWACPSVGAGFVPADGTGANGVLLVFEAAGEQESLTGKPLQGKAGLQFVKMLQRGGLKRDDFRIANVLSCRPPDNFLRGAPYEASVIASCGPLLDAEIASFRPRCIVAGGDIALRRLLPLDDYVTLTEARGYVFWSVRYQTWVIPTFHPSYIMRGKTNMTSVFIHDLQRAVEVAANGYAYAKTDYTLDPPHTELDAWLREFAAYATANPTVRLSEDIETPGKDADEGEVDLDDPTYTLLRVGFSYRPRHGLSVPFQAQYIPAIKFLTEHPCDKVWWNAAYDVPRLLANGFAIGGTSHDAMVAWHMLHSDLPKGLGFVATFLAPDQPMWKNESSRQPAYYNGSDADVAGINMARTEEEMHKASLWNLYEHHVLQLNPIRSAMSRAGMPIDPVKRLGFAVELDDRLVRVRAGMQEIVPLAARRVEPVAGFVRTPVDTAGMTTIKVTTFVARCATCGVINPLKPHFKEFKKKVNPCAGADKTVNSEVVERFARVVDFVPSNVQVLNYMRVMKHPPILDGRGKDRKPTSNEKALKILIGKYPADRLYPRILEFRELQKLAGNYIGNVEWETVEVPDDYVLQSVERAHPKT